MNKFRKVFWIILILYLIYFLCCIPEYILNHVLANPMYPEHNYKFWGTIFDAIHDNVLLSHLYHLLLFRIPNWTIIPMLTLNACNMAYGFMQYRKKWWMYLLVAVAILTVVILLDYLYLLSLPDWD